MGLVKPAWPVLQRGHPLTNGLIGAWSFYEGSGGTLNDLSGAQNNGAAQNGPVWTGGAFGSSLSLSSASSQYVQVPDSPSLNPAAVSVVALVNGTSFPNSYNTIVQKGNGSDFWEIFVTGAAKLAVYTPGRNYDGTGTFTLSPGLWYVIGFTFDTTGLAGYVNGQVDHTAGGAGLVSTTRNLGIGNDLQTGGRLWNGLFADLKIYNRALSASEMALLYFDPFAIYRPQTRFAQFVSTSAPPAACAPTLSLMGIGCGIQAARAVIRNRVVQRREIVAELLGVNDE